MPSTRRPRYGDQLSAAKSLLLLSPVFIAEAVRGSGVGWVAVFDQALEVLRARDVLGDTPLTGVFSRFGWSHPGPALYYFLAVPARLRPDPSTVIVYWTLLTKWVLVSLLARSLSLRLGQSGAVLMGAFFTLALVNSPESVWSYWNPVLAAATFGAALLLCLFRWDSDRALVAAFLFASASVQMHLGTLLPTAAVLLVAMSARVLCPSETNDGSVRWTRPIGTVLIALMWLPPVVDQVLVSGNLGKILGYVLHPGERGIGWSEACNIVARHLLPRAPWSGDYRLYELSAPRLTAHWLLVPALALLIVATAARADKRLRVAVAGLTASMIASISAVTRTTGDPWPYLHAWLVFLSAILWGTFVLAVVGMVCRHLSYLARVSDAVIVTLAVLVTSASVLMSIERPVEYSPVMAAVRDLTPDALALVPEGAEFTFLQADLLEGVGTGLALQYELHGRRIRVDTDSILDRAQLEASWGRRRLRAEPSGPIVAVVPGNLVPSFLQQGFTTKAVHVMPRGTNGRVREVVSINLMMRPA